MKTTLRYLLPGEPKLHVWAQLFLEGMVAGWTKLSDVEIIFYDGQNLPTGNLIDVDALVKYNKDKEFTSPVQRMTAHYPQLLDIPGMAYFQDRFDYNCNTGNLKKRFADNHFNLNNDWSRVPHNVPMHEHLLRMANIMFGVMEIYFVTAKLVRGNIKQITNPFCQDGLSQMLTILKRSSAHQDLWRRGCDLFDEIEKCFELEDRADQRTMEQAKKIQPELAFTVRTINDSQTMPAAVYRTDDKRIIRCLWRLHPEYGVLVMRGRDKNSAIFTKGQQDLSKLFTALDVREPGLWEHEARYTSPFIGNGCESRPKPASQLTPTDIRDLVIEHVTYVTRSQAATV